MMGVKMIPKILHLYWGRNQPLSYLRYLTVASFIQQNPDWDIVIGYPVEESKGHYELWIEQNKDGHGGKDYFDELNDFKQVRLNEYSWDYADWINTEVHRSDVYRWDVMSTMGGWWTDFDIIYFKPMIDISVYESVVFPMYKVLSVIPIGFFGCCPFNAYLREAYNKSLDALKDDIDYQAAGTYILGTGAQDGVDYISEDIVYPFKWNHLNPMLNQAQYNLPDECIGIHWFGGSSKTHMLEHDICVDGWFNETRNFQRIVKDITERLVIERVLVDNGL